MKKELESQLIEEFPDFFKDMYGDPKVTCMHWGCACGEGWYGIIHEICAKLKALGVEEFKFAQIKEKFGTLRLYYEYKKFPLGLRHVLNDVVWKTIKEAEEESAKVCELCGSREEIETKANRGWIQTLCAKCRQQASVK